MDDAAEKPYRSIREVSELLDVKPHVLRYWETQFAMLRPRKNRAGARMYRPKDVELLREIRELLHERGFTIAGARRKLLAERRAGEGEPAAGGAAAESRVEERTVAAAGSPASLQPLLREIRGELAEIAALLKTPPGARKGAS